MGASSLIHYNRKEFDTKVLISEVIIQIRNLAPGANVRFYADFMEELEEHFKNKDDCNVI